MARPTEHPFLSGNYAPVADETTITDLAVEGTIPPTLSGRYLRIGPNPIGNAPHPYNWTLGDGMVHAVALHAGRAISYRNRWVKTDAASTRLGTERVPGPRPGVTDTSNTTVICLGGRILSLGEGSLPYELNAGLDTIRRIDLSGEARGISAHPKTDPATGELHFICATDRPPQLHQVISARGVLTFSRPIPVPAARHLHDLAVTRRHVIFFGTGIVGVTARDVDGPVHWLATGTDHDVVPISAYDDGDTMCVHFTGSVLERWTLDFTAGDVRRDVVDETPQTLGRVNEPLVGPPRRFLYTVRAGAVMPFDGTEIYKHDLVTQTRDDCDFGPGRHPGEFLFVGDPQRHGNEDGGWLLGLVHDDSSDRDELLVLDAAAIERPPIATVHVPRRIPYGLHGTWIPTT
jgi:carotenoid cleavage dioxygenase